jgi:hypothetical protein
VPDWVQHLDTGSGDGTQEHLDTGSGDGTQEHLDTRSGDGTQEHLDTGSGDGTQEHLDTGRGDGTQEYLENSCFCHNFAFSMVLLNCYYTAATGTFKLSDANIFTLIKAKRENTV